MTFRHDEIRDWYGNVRLDHGYALTVAAAQGLTVDKTFLLADDRPSRETIYPAATRHREEIDVYVNRAPLALDVADRRADSDREAPVIDTELRAYLAERWSRASAQGGGARLHGGLGEWEDRDIRERAPPRPPAIGLHDDPGRSPFFRGERQRDGADRATISIGPSSPGATGRRWTPSPPDGRRFWQAWDALREKSRAEGDAVALSDPYRETLDRHAALLKQAEPFRARPEAFASLLAERARIGRMRPRRIRGNCTSGPAATAAPR